MQDSASIERQVAERGPWFHNLHLPNGIKTAPDHAFGDFPNSKWREIEPHLPKDMTGQRVLDIGCNAGFYSFEMARRGASVLGIDMNDHYLEQARWAAEVLQIRNVRFSKLSVYDIGRLAPSFDTIVFMGVLYHLRHPLLALDLIAGLKPKQLIFQTLTRGDDDIADDAGADLDFSSRERLQARDWPAMAFIENSFCGDPTNWWVPNRACVHALLRSSGFQIDQEPGHEIALCSPIPSDERGFVDEAHLALAKE